MPPGQSSTDKIERLEAALAASEEKVRAQSRDLALFRSVAEALPVGVVLTDADGQIIYGNAGLSAMVGHPVRLSQDVNSYREWEAYHADGRRVDSHEYPLARILREGLDRCELEVHYAKSDGSRFWMRIIGEPMLDQAGKVTGAIVVTINVDAEVELRTAQTAMIAELNHRVRNAFRVSQSIVDRVVRLAGGDETMTERIDTRLKAYAHAHTQLERADWARMSVRRVAEGLLQRIEADRITLSGPDLILPARTALSLSMALYELARNAAEHGALSNDDGRIELTWRVERKKGGKDRWRIFWREIGGPEPSSQREAGFGTFMTQRAISLETSGVVTVEYDPTGLTWSLDMPPPFAAGPSN